MNSGLREISTCEVCGSESLVPVLDLGLHPMCDDLVRVGETRVCREFPIEILFCDTCVTAHQRFQIPKNELFPASYHYRARFTGDVLSGMGALVDSCEQRFGRVSGTLVLDVGCNDGSLLSYFRARGATTVGIEPTSACADAAQNGHTTYNEFLSEEVAAKVVAAHGHPDFVTFTNVFAHVEDLGQVLRSLRILASSKTVIVVENHYLGAVLDRGQFDTFYHEHPRSYSYTSFAYIARALNRQILGVEFPSRYGGNIRVFLGVGSIGAEPDLHEQLLEKERTYLDKFRRLREGVERWRERKSGVLQRLCAERGKLPAKAFPGRAAILVKLLGLTDATISAVYEKPGSLKIGHYLPGTRIPILSDEELPVDDSKNRPIVNLAWHISDEIRGYLQSRGYRGEVVDVLTAEDVSTS